MDSEIKYKNMGICSMTIPEYKKPMLCIFIEPNIHKKVATFKNEESAQEFMDYLLSMLNKVTEDVFKCR